MSIRPDSRSRLRNRSGIRSRRLSPCYRHPDELNTGICASCLRERLSGLDSSGIVNAELPELRRCRSVVSNSSFNEKPCDVVSSRSSLSNLIEAKSGSEGEANVESRNVSVSRVDCDEKCEDEIRDLSDELGEFKTMKEFIDLEFKTTKSKDLREIAGNFLGAASVFTKKLRKWKQKNQKVKKLDNDDYNCKNVVTEKLGENHSEVLGRRSCDTEPRFSIDAGRISFEEPRASWDGYMIARTIPRLAPMFSVVENGVLGNIDRFENRRLSMDGPMQSIVEDESSSGASGSGHSNSDSSSSLRQSSFDRSSSVRSFGKKAITSEDDHGVSPANVKLVITEKELKDWHMRSGSSSVDSLSKTSSVTDGSSNNVSGKKLVRWRSVRGLFGLRVKNTDHTIDKTNSEQVKDRDIGWKFTRSSSGGSNDVIGSYHGRRSVDNVGGYALKGMGNFKLDRNRSVKYSPIDSGVATPFYMTPLRGLKNNKSGKVKLQNSNSVSGNFLQFN